ncbi:hypothetical protein [Aggregatibacter actinomycetemcomitans]|uniref:hypothetical protein n=1 Tax=Aggregatibacter actinomycetemcomitans TaxID=714 RepID=UPI00031511BD|nr:hypothetical protein [Aggregatibacter actinomycetemcomitans]KYK81794.1 hypothetical protein SC936_03250 [Aggregatibacter actinomycetemcomitans serotype e str. SC936]
MKNVGEGDRTLYCFFIVFSKCKTPNKMRKRNKLGRMLNQAGISGTKPMKTRAQEKTASFFI